VLLAYLIKEGLNEYAQVAATAQAYINDPETILTLVANEQLPAALEDLRGMESVLIDVDPEKEEMVPRPDPTEQVLSEAEEILEAARSEDGVLAEYEGQTTESLAMALSPDAVEEDVVADAGGLDAEDLEAAIERVTDTDLDSVVDRVAGDDEGVDDFGGFEPAAPTAESNDGATDDDSDDGAAGAAEASSDDETEGGLDADAVDSSSGSDDEGVANGGVATDDAGAPEPSADSSETDARSEDEAADGDYEGETE
jgi:flagellar protein FlaI